MKRRSLSIALAASFSMLASQAHAQQCIAEKQVESLAIYALPAIVKGVQTECVNELSDDGFLAQSGEAFVQPYLAMQDSVWPDAKAGFLLFAAKGEEDQAEDEMDLLASLPDEAVRPLLDLILTEKVGEEIKLSDCGRIERAVELVAPLPPENTGGLIALIAGLAGVDDPRICEYTSPQ